MKCKMDEFILFLDATYSDGFFWTILNSFNVLMGVDAQTGRVSEVLPFSKDGEGYYERIITIFTYGNALYILPSGKFEIIIIDIRTKEIRHVDLPTKGIYIGEAIFCSGYLCLFMPLDKKVAVVDIINMHLVMEIELENLDILEGKEKWSLFWCPMIYNKKVFVACQNTNNFLEIDLQSKKWKLIEQEDFVDGVQDVYATEKYIYILGVNGCVKRIDIESGENEILSAAGSIEGEYSRIVYMNDKIWLLPAYGNRISMLAENGEKIPLFSIQCERSRVRSKTITSGYYILDDYIYVYPKIMNCFFIINTKTCECKKVDLVFSEEVKKEIINKNYLNYYMAEGQENHYNISMTLEEYFDFVISCK